jgi:hypothetical protein
MAYIEGDIFWSFIVKNTAVQGRHESFRMIMTAMTAAALSYALYGREVLVDFSIPPWFLDTARKVIGSRDVPLDYVVLRPTETVCAARAAARTEGRITDYTPYRDLYSSFAEVGRHTVADDAGDPAAVAARIRDGLNAGIFRISN